MIAGGDTQAEGSGLGSPDASVITCPPEKPGRQVQVKPPCVLTQLALVAQPAVCRTHSLMSMLQLGPSNLNTKCASVEASAVISVLDVTAGSVQLRASTQTSYQYGRSQKARIALSVKLRGIDAATDGWMGYTQVRSTTDACLSACPGVAGLTQCQTRPEPMSGCSCWSRSHLQGQ